MRPGDGGGRCSPWVCARRSPPAEGLSGTGKGTTVAKLQSLLPNASCWSNGNIFRALTLLAVTYCETHGAVGAFSPHALPPPLAPLRECLQSE